VCTVQSELQRDVMCCTVLQRAGVAQNYICCVVYRGVFARIVFAVLYVELCVLHRVSCSSLLGLLLSCIDLCLLEMYTSCIC